MGGAIACRFGVGFVPVRKGGKLPGVKGTVIRASVVDYSGKKKVFEMSKGSIKRGDKVLIVDDWIETGKQIKAAIRLVEKQGGKIIGISTLATHDKPKKGFSKKYDFYSIREKRLG